MRPRTTACSTSPGVTFVASTGDYGAADPEYPAYSPNVVAVGGTSLTLNADNSYNSETGWGYHSDSIGAFIGSGGGLSLYEPEPAYQQGVQSTGSRTTPDVSLVADPATGAWIADPYNLDPEQSVRGRGRHQPVGPGLGRLAGAGQPGPGGRGRADLEQLEPDRDAASPLQLAPERLQRDHQRQQRLHRERRLQPGDRPGHARGQPAGPRPGRLPRARHDVQRARPLARCKMPTSSTLERMAVDRSMCSVCSIP